MYLLGLDIGSSSIKAGLVNTADGKHLITVQSPKEEMSIYAPKPGMAEQHPEEWWEHVIHTLQIIREEGYSLDQIEAIGIAYQMHGLVLVDQDQQVLRPAIIWCDSRAGSQGEIIHKNVGDAFCKTHVLNHPGNFTASKLAWVKEHEPNLFSRVHAFMLPGDYIAMKLTGTIRTTLTGLSEGILWDFKEDTPAFPILRQLDIPNDLMPQLVPVFGEQGTVSGEAARVTGLAPGTRVSYRAGDQPNNALSLQVVHPGEMAATAGTSGVIYGILDQVQTDPLSRVNVFAHVNHLLPDTRLGVLLCVNGTGILYAWLRRVLGSPTYQEMNQLAEEVEPGAGGLRIFPFGNGVERIHQNAPYHAHIQQIDFNRHQTGHILRAAQEGIIFALNYGFEAMREMGVRTEVVKAGKSNLFQSDLFTRIFASVTGTTVELCNTDGAAGAARGAGIGSGIFEPADRAFQTLEVIERIEPDPKNNTIYKEIYETWKLEMLRRITE